jgi:hypothetical protein
MKTRKTIYHLIVDKSGSMHDCIESTINGFNEQLNGIKRRQAEFVEEEITIGLTTFNEHVDHHYFSSNPQSASLLTRNTYVPNGSTALYDAIGETVSRLERDLRSDSLSKNTTHVLVILTDGYENASETYNLVKIRNMISRLEETGKWTFSFIGATLDAVEIAESMAIKRQNSFQFQKSEMNNEVWSKLDKSMGNYFSKKKQNRNLGNFFED